MIKFIQLSVYSIAILSSIAYGQDLTSKKGEPILPEKDDWCISIDANPFLNFIGNAFNKGGVVTTTNGGVVVVQNQAPTWNFLSNGQNITGKYFKDEKTAYRASLRLGFGGNTVRQGVTNRMLSAPSTSVNGYPVQGQLLENRWRKSSASVGVSIGIEKRKGKTRLQGYYGGEAGIYLSGSRDAFQYGNNLAVNVTNSGPNTPQNVTVSNDDLMVGANNVVAANSIGLTGANNASVGGPELARILTRKNGTTFSFGVRGFVGAEYFIAPKISLGGEFGWGLGLGITSKGQTVWESTGNPNKVSPQANSDVIGTTIIKGQRKGYWGFDNDNNTGLWGATGSLKLNFYF